MLRKSKHIKAGGFLPLFIALIAGVLMGLTVAPVSAWFLAWIALAPLWILIVEATANKSLALIEEPPLNPPTLGDFRFDSPQNWGGRGAIDRLPRKTNIFLCGLLWGIGYHGVAIWWITGIHPMTWMGVPWFASLAIAAFCWIFLTLWGAALVAVWATSMTFLGKKLTFPLRVLVGTTLWCGLESIWSRGALWWTTLAYTQSPHNIAILHLGQISGTTAVTAALVAVNLLIAEAWLNRSRTYLSYAASLLIGLHLIGWGLASQPLIKTPETALKIGIIQGNIPNEIKLYEGGLRRAIEGYTTGYKTLADQGVEAVLTPEGALPLFWRDIPSSSFYQAVREKGVVAWLGAFGEQGSSYTNSLFTLTGTGQIYSRYNKVKLVPLGEYIPFTEVLGTLINRLSPLEAHQVAGADNQVFDTPFGRAITSICYESAFGEHLRRQTALGGQFILSAANNAHYSPAMPAQHHAQDVMRAIESDRWAVRATNTGYSGIVDPHGKTEWISKLNTYQLHAATIYRRETKTLYVRAGDWLMLLLLTLSLLVLGIILNNSRSRQEQPRQF
ncbi:apolipoprotein N-acyltransferase [Chlorogloea sp. CCALA 695]|nr:apolipoprotein N-acyltransferase [Chlorogloea sp. CCALA 695]